MLHSKQLLSRLELGILPPFTVCLPLQKAVGLLLGLSAIYRERHLGRSRLTAPYSVSIRRYPVGRYLAYRKCVNRPAYTQSLIYRVYLLIPEFTSGSVPQPRTRKQPTGFTIYGLTRQATRQHLLSNPDFTDMLLSPRGFRMRLVGCLTSHCRSDDF